MPIEPNTGEWVPTRRSVPYKVGYMECVAQLAELRAEIERLRAAVHGELEKAVHDGILPLEHAQMIAIAILAHP